MLACLTRRKQWRQSPRGAQSPGCTCCAPATRTPKWKTMKKKDFSPSRLEMGNCIKETISRRPEGATMAPQGGIDYKYVTSKQIKKKKQYSSKLKKQDAPLCLGYHSFISACVSDTIHSSRLVARKQKNILSGPERAHTNFRKSGCKLKVCSGK